MSNHVEIEPRSYVKSVPLPIPSHKGIRIQARSDAIYNPTLPSRQEIRVENYQRRQQQQKHQGFQSVNYERYKGIGDPIYLDPKKLILNALGQWDEVIEKFCCCLHCESI